MEQSGFLIASRERRASSAEVEEAMHAASSRIADFGLVSDTFLGYTQCPDL